VISCTAPGCDLGSVPTGRLYEARDGRWLDETEACEHCRGTGAEPCVVPGCRDCAVVFDGEHLCESHEAEFAAMDAATWAKTDHQEVRS
jgi:hypothetical protein